MSDAKLETGQGVPDKTIHMINGTFVLLPFDVVRHIKELEAQLKVAVEALEHCAKYPALDNSGIANNAILKIKQGEGESLVARKELEAKLNDADNENELLKTRVKELIIWNRDEVVSELEKKLAEAEKFKDAYNNLEELYLKLSKMHKTKTEKLTMAIELIDLIREDPTKFEKIELAIDEALLKIKQGEGG